MKGCKVCHAVTQELDPTGRCQSCAAVLKASTLNLTYGKFMAAKAAPTPVKPIEVEELPSENPDGTPHICEYCGKTYFWNGHVAKYCSPECRAIGKREANRAYARKLAGHSGIRYCVFCGEQLPDSARWNTSICGKEACKEKRQNQWLRTKQARAKAKREAKNG